MYRYLCTLLLIAPLVLTGAHRADAQMQRGPARSPASVAGIYLNANQQYCYIYRQADGYLFVSETGTKALFAFTGPNQLEIVQTLTWDPAVVATVGYDVLGRLTIRFDAPRYDPVYWLLAS